MSKHTPGPWKAVPRDVDADKPGNMDIGESSGLGWDIEGPPEPQLRGQFAKGSDAQLIAAAPELLAALEHVKDCLRPFIENTEKGIVKGKPMKLSVICSAIAKAKGERRV